MIFKRFLEYFYLIKNKNITFDKDDYNVLSSLICLIYGLELYFAFNYNAYLFIYNIINMEYFRYFYF